MASESRRLTCVELLTAVKTNREIVQERTAANDAMGRDESILIADLGDVIEKCKAWTNTFPMINPYYAIKCNDDVEILKVLADMGSSFDCASQEEIRKVLDIGVAPDRIIYANTIKPESMLRYADKQDVALMTFDNEDELIKIHRSFPTAKLILRIKPVGNFAMKNNSNRKFGCNPSNTSHLFQLAKILGLTIIGVSFYVSSVNVDMETRFEVAIKQSRDVFDLGRDMGFNMHLLNVDGGFPGHSNSSQRFTEVACIVKDALNKYFPASEGVQVIAEPGRYFVKSSVTLCIKIIGRCIDNDQDKSGDAESDFGNTKPAKAPYKYYANDGVYGPLAFVFQSPWTSISIETVKDSSNDVTYTSSIWGPTCDSFDLIKDTILLPELQVGEWLYIKDAGAYFSVRGSRFNNIPEPDRHYICLQSLWNELRRPN